MTRNVKVYKWQTAEGQTYCEKVLVGEGTFHEFGCSYEEFETGAGNFSTAIVEMPDGTVENVGVELIVFID